MDEYERASKTESFELEHEHTRINKNGTVRSRSRRSSLPGANVSSQKSSAKKLMEVGKIFEKWW